MQYVWGIMHKAHNLLCFVTSHLPPSVRVTSLVSGQPKNYIMPQKQPEEYE